MHIKQLTLLLLLAGTTQVLSAQTKMIAHKSHSGSSANFARVTPGGLFDDDGSNYGQAPEPTIRTAQLDSVIWLSDSLVVMITSEFCKRQYQPKPRLWRAGRDTLVNHPLYSGGFSLAEIKNRLRENYYFQNPVEQVIFIGFKEPQPIPPQQVPPPQKRQQQGQQQNQQQGQEQNQQQQEQQGGGQASLPMVVPGDNTGTPPAAGFPIAGMLATIAFFALLSGFVSWLMTRFQRDEKLA